MSNPVINKKRFLPKGIRWILFLAISVLFGRYVYINRSDFSILNQIQWHFVYQIAVFLSVNYLVLSYRFFITVKYFIPDFTFFQNFSYFVIGQLLGSIIPQGSALYKSINMKIQNQLPYKRYLACHLFFYWINHLVTFLIGIIIVSHYDPHLIIGMFPILPILSLVLASLVLVVPVTHFAHHFISRLGHKNSYVMEQIELTVQGFLFICKKPSIMVLNGISILINLLIETGLLIIIFGCFNVKFNISIICVFLILTKLSNAIIVTPGNFGIRELVFGFLTESLGTSAAIGVSASLLLRVVNLMVLALFSTFCIVTEKLKKN